MSNEWVDFCFVQPSRGNCLRTPECVKLLRNEARKSITWTDRPSKAVRGGEERLPQAIWCRVGCRLCRLLLKNGSNSPFIEIRWHVDAPKCYSVIIRGWRA